MLKFNQKVQISKIISNTFGMMLRESGSRILMYHSIGSLVDNDKNGKIHYASLQSDIGQSYLTKFKMSGTDLNSVVLIEGERFYTKSDAPLRLVKYFDKKIWRLSAIFFIVPKFIRDAVYNYIAKNRYKWFGKQESCMLPTPDLRSRFLE